MKFKNSFIDLTKSSDVDKLAEMRRQQSLGNTKRYQCKTFEYMEDEFHPLWHTFIKGSHSLEVKVNIKSFDKNSGQLDSSDNIWFDLKVKKSSVEAVCQLYKQLRFVVASETSTTNKIVKNMTT